MGVVTYFREALFYDITIILRSRFLGEKVNNLFHLTVKR